jgi:RNA polymerase subunit RPABC4/transcription elongation factor Spt4
MKSGIHKGDCLDGYILQKTPVYSRSFYMFILTWLVLCFITALFASKKGRSAIGFFFLAFFLSPLVGLIAVAVASPNTKAVEGKQISSGNTKKCPYCAELIKSEAKICRYCQKDQPVEDIEEIVFAAGHKAKRIGKYTKYS